MSEIIDILTLDTADAQRFTCDNTQYSVPLPAIVNFKTFKNPVSNKTFRNGDNFHISAIMAVFPEAFTIYKDPAGLTKALPLLNLALYGVSGTFYYLPGIANQSGIFLPAENYEVAVDIFCNVTAAGINENFTIVSAGFSNCPIAMTGSPAAYNGKTFIVSPVLKIVHNFYLT